MVSRETLLFGGKHQRLIHSHGVHLFGRLNWGTVLAESGNIEDVSNDTSFQNRSHLIALKSLIIITFSLF